MSMRHFVEVPPGTRRRVETLIETLIELLDTLDGNSDLEEGLGVEAAVADDEESEPWR